MNRDDEIILKIKGLSKITDSDELEGVKEDICKEIENYPEGHAVVQAYYAVTGDSFSPGFDPANL